MPNELVEQPFTIQPISFPVPSAKIAEWSKEFMPLKVASINDKMGLAAVHNARMVVKGARVDIEKRRKELKASSLEYGKKVDSAAKELTALLEPIEKHLEDQEAIVQREKERIAAEEKAAWEVKMNARIAALQEVGAMVLTSVLEAMSDEEFATKLAASREDKKRRDEEAARLEAERKEREEADRIERERLAKEREELERQKAAQEQAAAEQRRIEEDRIAKETARLEKQRLDLEAEKRRQREEQEKIEAEKRRLEAEEAERKRQAELEEARKRAAEEARLAAIEEQKRKEREEKERAEAEEKERKRIEALKPDHEKLMAVVAAVQAIKIPKVSEAAEETAEEIGDLLFNCAREIESAAKSLVKSHDQSPKAKAKRKAELQTA